MFNENKRGVEKLMMGNPKEFIVHTIDNKIDNKDNIIRLETIQKNIREKRRIIDNLKTHVISLIEEFGKDHIEIVVIEKDIKILEEEVSILWDLFRGKTKQKGEHKIYIPTTVDKAINFVAFLMNDNAIQNEEEIRTILNIINNDPNLSIDSANKHSLCRIQLNLDYLNSKMKK